MFSSTMKFRYQSLIRVHDCCVRRKTEVLEPNHAIADEYAATRLLVYFNLIFALQCLTCFSFNLSKRYSVLIFHMISQSALNAFLTNLLGLKTQLLLSSSELFNSESGWSQLLQSSSRFLGFELNNFTFSVAKIQDFLHLSFLKLESVLQSRRHLENTKSFFGRISHAYSIFFSRLIGSKLRKNVARDSAMVSWRYSPRIWTWPWLGSLLSYTRDPLGFIQKHQKSRGDVFTTTILGYDCTFIQSSEYIRSFSTATRKVLDVTAAYKLVAAPLIGEEAFFGQTKYMNRVVLSKSRIEQLHGRLWELAEELIEIKWSQCLSTSSEEEGRNWHKIDVGQLLDYVIFGLDMFVLIGEQMVNVNLDRISQLFRVIDSDLSLLGILLPMLKGGCCPRKYAKDELLGFLKRDVKRRVERHVQRAVNITEGPCHFDSTDDWNEEHHEEQSQQELPDLLLCSELKDLDESILLEYHRGEQSAIDAINEKVELIALFIYGFVWAAQTNSAAATIGVVNDILYHDQPDLSDSKEYSEASHITHVDRIRQECGSAVLFTRDHVNKTRAPHYQDMPHLTNCLNETLRLRATGAWIRLAEKPFHLTPQATNQAHSFICPPGFIVLSPMSVSLNPSVYLNPTRWDPFRYRHAPFLPTSSESGKDSTRHIPLHKTYLIPPATPSAPYFASWGLGQGHCPGKHLAYKMVSMTVARFFEKFEARPIGDRFETAKFEDIAAAGVQRLKNGFIVLIRKRNT